MHSSADAKFISIFPGAVAAFPDAETGPNGPPRWVLKPLAKDLLAAPSADCVVTSIAAELDRLISRRWSNTEPPVTDWLLMIPPIGPNGFEVELSKQADYLDGAFGGLHESFTSLDEALVWVGRAISNSYQLRTISYGAAPSEWLLEPVALGHNGPVLAMGHVSWMSTLKKRSVAVRSNALPAHASP